MYVSLSLWTTSFILSSVLVMIFKILCLEILRHRDDLVFICVAVLLLLHILMYKDFLETCRGTSLLCRHWTGLIDHVCASVGCISAQPIIQLKPFDRNLSFASKRHLSHNAIFYSSFITFFFCAAHFVPPWGIIKPVLITFFVRNTFGG